jgi:hypothetical protein
MSIHTILVTHPWFSAGLLSILTGILLLAGKLKSPGTGHPFQDKSTPPPVGPGSLTYQSFGAVFLIAGLVLIIVQFIPS